MINDNNTTSESFAKLLTYLEHRLAAAGLKLSPFGETELLKRFNKPEKEGGLSNYWKTYNQ